MSEANQRQVGGNHYKKHGANGEQHWDRVARLYGEHAYVYFVGCITKYVERFRDKGGIQDLEKARHYLDKLIELEKKCLAEKGPDVCDYEPWDDNLKKYVQAPHNWELIQTPTGEARRCTRCKKQESIA